MDINSGHNTIDRKEVVIVLLKLNFKGGEVKFHCSTKLDHLQISVLFLHTEFMFISEHN